MNPNEYKNPLTHYTIHLHFKSAEQIRDDWFADQETLLDVKEVDGFPEANEVINRIKAL